jgi:hypothetical protein
VSCCPTRHSPSTGVQGNPSDTVDRFTSRCGLEIWYPHG